MTILPRFLAVVVAMVFLAFAAGSSLAQVTDEQRANYAVWQKTAERAEQVIDAGRAGDAALDMLRREIADYRERFSSTRDVNAARIRTLQSQLDALGPVPAEVDVEAADIADLRASLTGQLNALRVPRVVAEESYNRANGLISEIDRIIRERHARELLTRGPSPLFPAYWPIAWREVSEAGVALVNETAERMQSSVTREQARDKIAVILLLLAVGIVLVLRARRWAEHLGGYLRQFGGAGTGVWSFVVSLAKIALPMVGVYCVTKAVALSEMLGLRGLLLVESVPKWALIFLCARWLADQMFERRAGDELVPVSTTGRGRAKVNFALAATCLVLHDLVDLFGQIERVSAETRAVIGFLVILVTSLLLLIIQRNRLRALKAMERGAEGVSGSTGYGNFFRLIRRTVIGMAVVSPIMAGLGYVLAAEAIVYPAVWSLALFSVVMVLQRFLSDIYAWISGKGTTAGDSLFAVLAGFVLFVLAMPVFALVWGARVADLTEMWTRFQNGIQIGESTISPSGFMAFVVVFGVGYMITRLVQGGLRNSLLPKTRIDPGGQNAIVAGTGYVGIFLAALIGIGFTGLDLSSLAIVAGALSVGIGFGLQTIVSNFVSGIILLIERPISKGDWVEVGGIMGYVRDISVRSTRIETFDRTDVIVPNSDLIAGTVTNYTRGKTFGRVIVPVGVAYGSDVRKVERILLEIANAHPMVLADPPARVNFLGFGADSLNFDIRAVLRDVNWSLTARSEMNFEIDRRFREEGIEIPFAQRDIWLRNPEALAGLSGKAAAPAEKETDRDV